MFSYNTRQFRLCSLIIFAILAFISFYNLPGPPTITNDIRPGRPTPNHDVENRPHFLHRSSFRDHPDVEYEAQLEAALKNIEAKVLSKHGGSHQGAHRIWQIMLEENFRDQDRGLYSHLFQQENGDWRYTLITRDWATLFLTETLSTVPDLLDVWNSFPHNVLRGDLLRYLILWYYGGYYADIDIYPAKSINACPSLQPLFTETPPDISLVLGIEIDEPHASPKLMRDWHWSRSYGFIQYNMFAPRRFSPILRTAIVRVLAHTKQLQEQSSFLRMLIFDEKTILEVTGPGVLTDAALDVLSETLPPTHELIHHSVDADEGVGDLVNSSGQTEKRVTWAPFNRIQQPLWIDASAENAGSMGGLGVLPVSVWGNGQRHSGAEGYDTPHACVHHSFGRTWKKGWLEYLFG